MCGVTSLKKSLQKHRNKYVSSETTRWNQKQTLCFVYQEVLKRHSQDIEEYVQSA